MKKKVIYWSPCLNAVGTIKSTVNSAVSLSKYSKDYEVAIINACGEWDKYLDYFKVNHVKIINFNQKTKYFIFKFRFFKPVFFYQF